MQVVLEAVADAVSQLILFSVEAEENKAQLSKLAEGATKVQRAVGILLGIGEKMYQGWTEEKMQAEMRDACSNLRRAGSDVAALAGQMQGGWNETIKVKLSESARAILHNTIQLLRLADQHDVVQITKAAHLSETALDDAQKVRQGEDIVEVKRHLSHRAHNLVNLSQERISLLADVTFKRRLETADRVLQSDVDPYLDTVSNQVQGRGEQSKQLAHKIQDAITEIIVVSRLSSQHMWDKVNLDINAMIRGKLPPLQALKQIRRAIDDDIDRIARAVEAHDRPQLAEAMRDLGNDINQAIGLGTALSEMCDDPKQRKDIVAALEALDPLGDDFASLADAYLGNPTPANRAALDRALEAGKKANANLVDASLPLDNRFLGSLDDIDKALQKLLDAVRNAKKPEVSPAIKDLIRDLEREAEIAREYADKEVDPIKKKAILDAIDGLAKLREPLINAAKAYLQNPNDPNILAALERAAKAAMDGANLLKDLIIPLSDEIDRKAKQLEDDLGRLVEAVKEGKKDEALPLMKQVHDDIADHAKLTDKFADRVADDPFARQQFHEDADTLRSLDPPLLRTAKAALQNPDEGTLRHLEDQANEIADLANKTAQRAKEEAANKVGGGEDDLLRALDKLKDALDKLKFGGQNRDAPAIIAAVKEAVPEINREADIGKQLAQKLPNEPDQRKAMQAADRLKGLQQPLAQAAKDAIASPDGARKLDEIINEVRDAATKLPEALQLSPDKQLARQAPKLDEALDQLYNAAKKGDKKEAEPLLKSVPKAMDDQAERAKRLAKDTDAPIRKKQLLNDADAMKKLPAPLADAVAKLLNNPADKAADEKARDLIDKVKELNHRLADPNEALMTPGEKLAKDLEDLRRAVHKPSVGETDAALRAVARDAPLHMENAKAFFDKLPGQNLDDLLNALKRLDDLLKQLPYLARKAAANPKDEAAQKAFDDIIQQVRELNDKINDGDLINTPERRVMDNWADIDTNLGNLREALKRGDKDKAQDALKKLLDGLKNQAALAREMAKSTEDPERKKQYQQLADAMDALHKPLQEVSKKLMANPNDPAALKELDNLQGQIQNLNDRLAHLIQADNADKLEREMNKIQEAVARGENPDLGPVKDLLRRQAAMAKARAARTNDPKKRKELLAAARDLQDAIKAIVDASRTKNLEKLRNITDNIINHTEALKVTSDDPFEAASQQIEAAASRKRKALADQPEGSPAHRLLDSSSKIAQLMAKLAEASKSGNKKDMILITRQIAAEIQLVSKAGEEIAQSCPDQRLKNDLISFAAPMKNFAVQLKIMTAVKSSTSDDDRSTELQLVACAKGIASGVVSCVGAAEVALIRANRKK